MRTMVQWKREQPPGKIFINGVTRLARWGNADKTDNLPRDGCDEISIDRIQRIAETPVGVRCMLCQLLRVDLMAQPVNLLPFGVCRDGQHHFFANNGSFLPCTCRDELCAHASDTTRSAARVLIDKKHALSNNSMHCK